MADLRDGSPEMSNAQADSDSPSDSASDAAKTYAPPPPRTPPAPEPQDPRHSDLRIAVAKLSEQLERRGAEIDSLQIEAARKTRPFYRDPAVIISILALAASLVATFLSQRSSTEDRLAQERIRLTTVIERITDIRQRSAQVRAELGDSAPQGEIVAFRPALNEAFALSERLRNTPQASTPFEKSVIASGFIDSNDPALAIQISTEAEGQSGTLSEKVESARGVAVASFLAGRVESGRAAFERVISYAEAERPNFDNDTTVYYQFVTLAKWVELELKANDCVAARQRLSDLNARLSQFTPVGRNGYTNWAQSTTTLTTSACG